MFEKPPVQENNEFSESDEFFDAQIEQLLQELYQFDFKNLDPKMQEKWYWTEMEAETGKDRKTAHAKLNELIEELRTTKETAG